MNTSDAPRKTIARKPSHFGSNRKSGELGSSSAILASIGSIGGAIANMTPICAETLQDFRRVVGQPRPLTALQSHVPGMQPAFEAIDYVGQSR